MKLWQNPDRTKLHKKSKGYVLGFSTCDPPFVNMQNSGPSWEYPVAKSIAEKITLEAKVTIDCPNNDASYLWQSWIETESAKQTLELTSGPEITLEPFSMSPGKAVVCLNVSLNSSPFHSTESCGYFIFCVPDPKAQILKSMPTSADPNQVLSIDASDSLDPLDVANVPNDHQPGEPKFEWYCSQDLDISDVTTSTTAVPVTLNFNTGNSEEEEEEEDDDDKRARLRSRRSVGTMCATSIPEKITSCTSNVCQIVPADIYLGVNRWIKFEVSTKINSF